MEQTRSIKSRGTRVEGREPERAGRVLVACSNLCGRKVWKKKNANLMFCPVCRAETRKDHEQRRSVRRKNQPKNVGHLPTLGDVPPQTVARILKTTEKNIWRIERQALDKIKRNKRALAVLREYWAAYLEGGREQGAGSRERVPVDAGEQLLEYQLQVSAFYESHDRLMGEGKKAEAVECLALIMECQDLIAREIGRA